MRHRKKVKKLGRTASHRKATLRNLAAAIIRNHQVKTTLAKAKAARSVVERLITYGKENTVHARRLAFKVLQNRTLVKKLFDEIAPTYNDRQGGYTRVIKLGQRMGDGAHLAMLQLVGFEQVKLETKEKPSKKKAAPKAKEEKVAAKEETPEKAEEKKTTAKAKSKTKAKPKKEEPKKKTPEQVEETEPQIQEEAERVEAKEAEVEKETAPKKSEKKTKTAKAEEPGKEEAVEESTAEAPETETKKDADQSAEEAEKK